MVTNSCLFKLIVPSVRGSNFSVLSFSGSSDTVMSDSEDSTVTYTAVSSPFEDGSDIGSPGVDGPPIMPEDPYAYIMVAYQVPPSPDYIPGLEVPPSPDYIPGHEESRSPPPLDFVPESDPEEEPKEDDEDPEEDPADYPADRDDVDDDEEDEDEEEELTPFWVSLVIDLAIFENPSMNLL
ncbi:hypothetical protein Tco_1340310 [Tanacetum coccineum]